MSGESAIHGPMRPGYEEILCPEAIGFVAELTRAARPMVMTLLRAREQRQADLERGASFDFLPQTEDIRRGDWRVAEVPADLQDRRVEITGPVDRKMVINALNSGANCFMADFEDATSPTWDNLVQGQINLRDAVNGSIDYEDPINGKRYALNDRTATLLVRPRGWHLWERHMSIDGEPVPGAVFDFGLYLFHNARRLVERGSGPYFYLPKLESHQEARLWNELFVLAQRRLGLPQGTIKATVLIETIPAAFEMDEILHELREHSAGLNCGRWDYIFSYIKKFRNRADRILPDRHQVGMTQPFMRAYTQLVIKTCHRRGAHAMGGMAAQIPVRADSEANERALEKVRQDKLREVTDGHDGTWVAHPALIPVARKVFDENMQGANQIDRQRDDVQVSSEALLQAPEGDATEAGLRDNIRVGIQYIEAWLGGRGAVPLYHLMEDAATAEIARAQIWQWLRHGVRVEGEPLTEERLQRTIQEELARVREEVGQKRIAEGHFDSARAIFEKLCLDSEFVEFLTLPAYERLLQDESGT